MKITKYDDPFYGKLYGYMKKQINKCRTGE